MKKIVLSLIVVFNLAAMTAAVGMYTLKDIPSSWQLAAAAAAMKSTVMPVGMKQSATLDAASPSVLETAYISPVQSTAVSSTTIPNKDASVTDGTPISAPASGTIQVSVTPLPARPIPSLACLGASSAIAFSQPYAGATYNQGGIIPVNWSWTNPNPAPDTSIYLIPQAGGAPILYSQYSMVTNVSTNGQLRVTAINGSDVQSRVPMTVPSGQYRMKIVNGNTQFMGCSGVFNIAPAPICTPTLAYSTQWGSMGTANGQFRALQGVAVDNTGAVYAIDAINNRVQKFTSTGTYITQWGTTGSGNGQFNSPAGIAVDMPGNVYVLDRVNNRVQKFTSNGTYITQWGTHGSNNGQFILANGQSAFASAIATDTSGNVYVGDGGNNRIEKFTSNGTYITQWGSQGTGTSQFSNIMGIAVSPTGNVYVSDQTQTGRVQKFTSTGTFVSQWSLSAIGWSIATDTSGNVYVGRNADFQKFTSTGTLISQWGTPGSGNGQFISILGIAADSIGNVYTSEFSSNDRIQKFVPQPCIQS
jgi:hypothetical protein